jgi:hypothetical protein
LPIAVGYFLRITRYADETRPIRAANPSNPGAYADDWVALVAFVEPLEYDCETLMDSLLAV